MGKKKRGFFCFFLSCLLASSAFAVTNSLPQLQALYGGQISGLDTIRPAGTTNQVRIFAKTDFSANSIFYADIDYSQAAPFSTNNYSWHVVPDFDARAGFGSVDGIAAHQDSGRLFVANEDGLLSCTTASGTLVTNISSSGSSTFLAVSIQDSVLLAIASRHGADVLFFGALDPSGNFTQGSGSPINIGLSAFSGTAIQMAVNPVNHRVYIIDSYGTNGVKKSSAAYDALSSATTFSTVDISSVITNWSLGRQLGFGPDGRMFIGSKVTSSSINTIAYSDDDGTNWTTVATGVIGKGCNFDTAGSSSQYSVVFGRAVSTNKGVSGSWFTLGAGDPPGQVRANDSSSKFIPGYPELIYFASDQGVGTTTNGGYNLREIDFGLEAVAIQGIDMNAAKTLGWTASASGLRRGTGASGAIQWDSTGMFPMDDSAPYYSVALDKTDSSGNTVYAGNGYIYKTTDGGTNWTKVYQPFSGSSDAGLYVSSIAASRSNVFAGIYVWSGSFNSNLLYSANAGATWNNYALEGTNGINVNKVLLTTEGGVPIAYVAAEFNTNSLLGGHIYRITQSGAGHIILGSENISVRDLATDSGGGIYASGWDLNCQPMVFYKPADSSEWTQLTTNGLPNISFYSTGRGPVITIGRDASSNEVPVVGAGVTLYYLSPGASSWSTSDELKYPNGTKLNALYWDALLVGTTIGLYGQNLSFQSSAVSSMPVAADFDGDAKADPAIFNTNGNWKIKLSSANYAAIPLTGFLGESGYTALAADFDGDRKADPAIYSSTLALWAVKLSSLNYLAPTVLTDFGGAGWQAVAGDFDGDAKADPGLYNTNPSAGSGQAGTWKVKLSTAGYQTITAANLLGYAGCTAIAADFDRDGKVDPAVYSAASGSWIVVLSSMNYGTAIVNPWLLGSTGYFGVGADFDGDAYADPAVAQYTTGNWKVRLSSGNYRLIELNGFLGE